MRNIQQYSTLKHSTWTKGTEDILTGFFTEEHKELFRKERLAAKGRRKHKKK